MTYHRLFEKIIKRIIAKRKPNIKEEIEVSLIEKAGENFIDSSNLSKKYEIIPEGKVTKKRIVQTADGKYKIQRYAEYNKEWSFTVLDYFTLEEAKKRLKEMDEYEKKLPFSQAIIKIFK